MATENLTTGYSSYEPPPRASPDEQQPSVTPRPDQYQLVPPNHLQAEQHQTGIIVAQQTAVVNGVIILEKPNDYMTFSILNTLFCCLCFGLAAISHSAKVNSEYAAGRIQEAIIASQAAKRLNILGFAIGITVNLTSIICIFIIILVSTSDKYDN